MGIERQAVINLYRNLIKESKKWNSYNYREYALRKIRDEFRSNKVVDDESHLKLLYKNGVDSLEMIKRQVIIGNLYSTRPLVIESQKLKKSQKQN